MAKTFLQVLSTDGSNIYTFVNDVKSGASSNWPDAIVKPSPKGDIIQFVKKGYNWKNHNNGYYSGILRIDDFLDAKDISEASFKKFTKECGVNL